MDKVEINKKIHNEIERRRAVLIKLSYDNSFPMNSSERIRIQSLLERWETPNRPVNIVTLTKQFCVSTFSYAPLRKYLSTFIGDLPMRETIQLTLSKVFDESAFLLDSNWIPESLSKLVLEIQAKENYDLSRKQFKPRIISVLISGTRQLSKELINGLDAFYNKISNAKSPLKMWELAENFSAQINNVGTALICDFFKELGFTRYVKVDHHFRREFPELVSDLKTCDKNPKMSFILSQEIADSIGITPFHLDSILYLWGRFGKK